MPLILYFLSSSHLIDLSRISITMLNESGWNGHPCLFPKGKLSVFHYYDVRYGLSHLGFKILRCKVIFFFSRVCWLFLLWKMLNLVKCFSCTYWDNHVIFIFHAVNDTVSHLLICGCQTILASQGWIPHGHGVWSLMCH